MFQSLPRRLPWLAFGLGLFALLPLTGVLHAQRPGGNTNGLPPGGFVGAPGFGGNNFGGNFGVSGDFGGNNSGNVGVGGNAGNLGGQIGGSIRLFPSIQSYLGVGRSGQFGQQGFQGQSGQQGFQGRFGTFGQPGFGGPSGAIGFQGQFGPPGFRGQFGQGVNGQVGNFGQVGFGMSGQFGAGTFGSNVGAFGQGNAGVDGFTGKRVGFGGEAGY